MGSDTGYSCSSYTPSGVDTPGGEALEVDHVQYRYEVRQSRTAALVGTFDLDSDGRHTLVDLQCPDHIGAGSSKDSAVAEVTADSDLATALKSYIESPQP
ncbi:hypothetical protein DMA12_46675 [Amycolatopsis balhimycina DSM 5908]|uniref:Uncharacterized protein n=1 Tax=Amycolatopsis balhimycina DSM 5908 TaxID=1081091 RepID=A0A428VVI4_AMYBA|nr:hypothetical protein DMA12_46675 [Amycolatopsis balhimycina DSM 5908]